MRLVFMVKVRFAPSPTGNLHVGNLRTAVLNYLYARNQGGTFTLRIEDTDMERSEIQYEASIMDDLKWLGINWDDGPYRQSERTDLYRDFAKTLLEKGSAYKCFCPKEKLEDARRASLDKGEPPRYDGRCRSLSQEELNNFEREGRSYVVRFKPPRKAIIFKDGIRGQIQFPPDHVDDFILLKQELTPSYNFAAAIDDMTMGITHVIRGGDHISNTPKQIMLFEALGKKPLKYAHHSLLIGNDKKPLSKRHGATRITEFRDMGILNSALVNYIGILGRGVVKEVLNEDELARTFSLRSLSGSDSVFDMEKLLWLNKEHLRRMPVEALLSTTGLNQGYSEKLLLLRENARTLVEMKELLGIFEGTEIANNGLDYLANASSPHAVVMVLKKALDDGSEVTFEEILEKVIHAVNAPKKELFLVLRILITGRTDGPPLKDIFHLIPRVHILERIRWLDRKLSSQ
ncbi:MAG: gltX [Deltaproteobacteria bacterium]|nr:gltX [Deltaproteobacteria bacterium]